MGDLDEAELLDCLLDLSHLGDRILHLHLPLYRIPARNFIEGVTWM